MMMIWIWILYNCVATNDKESVRYVLVVEGVSKKRGLGAASLLIMTAMGQKMRMMIVVQ